MNEFKDKDAVKQGLATNFLKHAALGEKIMGFFPTKKGQLSYPDDPRVPLLLISAGSGFAPFMSFIECRAQSARSGIQTGPILIFHGCRYKELDFLDTLLKEASTVLSFNTFRAYSQPELTKSEPEKGSKKVRKGYVQDLIAEEGVVLARLARDGGYVYVCGANKVINAVRVELQRALDKCGWVSLEQLTTSKRYQEEKYG